MISVYLDCQPEQQDELIAELNERGTLGVLETGVGVRAWFEDSAGLEDLIVRFDGHVLAEDEGDEDWVRRTQESFPPLEIGERFWLAPPWNQEPAPPGRLRLEINPGAACGTGWHECTQMCLAAMERYVRPGDRALDVGVGSGILSAAALLLGAASVVGCDVDFDAVAIARERLGPHVFAGTVGAVRTDWADVAIANISEPVVMALLPELRRVSHRTLILSGFASIEPVPGTVEILERNGWRCVVTASRPRPDTNPEPG